MGKIKSVAAREKQLEALIRGKYGEFDASLSEAVETAAMNRQMIDKMHSEIMNGDLTSCVAGSMGQVKTEINPLVAAYDKAQRTYIQQLAALGLNKMAVKKEDASGGVSDAEKLNAMYS